MPPVTSHEGLDSKTPAKACGIKIEGKNKCLILIQNTSYVWWMRQSPTRHQALIHSYGLVLNMVSWKITSYNLVDHSWSSEKFCHRKWAVEPTTATSKSVWTIREITRDKDDNTMEFEAHILKDCNVRRFCNLELTAHLIIPLMCYSHCSSPLISRAGRILSLMLSGHWCMHHVIQYL